MIGEQSRKEAEGVLLYILLDFETEIQKNDKSLLSTFCQLHGLTVSQRESKNDTLEWTKISSFRILNPRRNSSVA